MTNYKYCDLCSRADDPNFSWGTYDELSGVYACSVCSGEWEAFVMRGVEPTKHPDASSVAVAKMVTP